MLDKRDVSELMDPKQLPDMLEVISGWSNVDAGALAKDPRVVLSELEVVVRHN
jgi:hypothetical protein